MIKKRKILASEEVPFFEASIENMPEESKIFIDKSMEIADYILSVMEQKGLKQKNLADQMGKSEAEISKWLSGSHNFTLRSLAKLEAALSATLITTPRHYYQSALVYAQNFTTQSSIVAERREKFQRPKTSETIIMIEMHKKSGQANEALAA